MRRPHMIIDNNIHWVLLLIIKPRHNTLSSFLVISYRQQSVASPLH